MTNRVQASRDPSFWEQVYQAEEARWDLGGPSMVLQAALGLGLLAGYSRVFVPGCGKGHDALLLAEEGHRVVACDFAASAVESVRSEARARSLDVDVRQCSIFDFAEEPAASFDSVYEYTCFCAIDPALRDQYVDLVTHLVRPGGRMIFMAFPLENRELPPPPHGLSLELLHGHFDESWTWIFDSESPRSPEPRRGKERIVLLERKT